MSKDTKKFGLLIVDDDKKWRGIYREALSDHYMLKNTWDFIEEYEDANSALTYIKDYKKSGDYNLLIITDAYMHPNCDGSSILNPNKLFGGLWLIDKVNTDNELKGFVTILLVTYYDDQIKPYRNGNKNEFKWADGIDYYFVEKPHSQSSGRSENETKYQLSNSSDRDELFNKTFEAVWKIIEDRRKKAEKFTSIIGNSKKIKEVFEMIEKLAQGCSTVLITGECGTGKELVANEIHNCSRKEKPFVSVNCAAIPESLLESELFGHEKDAFTGATKRRIGKFEDANRGTIFLDEVGDMSMVLQAKVLRVIQERTFERIGGNAPIKVDVRIIAATNKNLLEEIKKGAFREDLYFRLHVIPIHMPPLRERKEDIPLLVQHFLGKYKDISIKTVSDEAINILKEYNWPGNVRELENVTERLLLLSNGDMIETDDVKDHGHFNETIKSKVTFDGIPTMIEVEKELYIHALKYFNGIRSRVANALGVNPTTVTNKMKEYKIEDI